MMQSECKRNNRTSENSSLRRWTLALSSAVKKLGNFYERQQREQRKRTSAKYRTNGEDDHPGNARVPSPGKVRSGVRARARYRVCLIVLVRIVLRFHWSSGLPLALPSLVNGVSNMKQDTLWVCSNSVCRTSNSVFSKYGMTCVTWIYAILGSNSLTSTGTESIIILTFSDPYFSLYKRNRRSDISDNDVTFGSL